MIEWFLGSEISLVAGIFVAVGGFFVGFLTVRLLELLAKKL